MRLGGTAALALLLGLLGCAPDYVTDNAAQVNLIVAAVNGWTSPTGSPAT
jgi:hypothetical protein